jgi:SAM-dependent methyltransferase
MALGNMQIRQSAAFSSGEGDQYFERNKNAPMNYDLVRKLITIPCKPKTIVEIGCGYGRYLNEMQKHYHNSKCIGFDPSMEAIDYGRRRFHHIDLRVGTAGSFYGLHMDILVFGFCLYLVDRHDLFRVVDDADWCLNEKGFLVVHDFDPPTPEVVPYKHADGVYSYKMDYSKLWLANPAYELVSKTTTGEGESVTIIQKKGWGRWRTSEMCQV